MDDPYVSRGATVYDPVGYTVGTLRAYDAWGGYLTVRTGWLSRTTRTDLYIPLDAVDRSGGAGLSLRRPGARGDISLLISKDALTADCYHHPPTGHAPGAEDDGQDVATTTGTTPAQGQA